MTQTRAVAIRPAADGAEDNPPVLRMERLTKEVGWLLVTAGVIGVIAPGIPGTPFLIIGGLVVIPGGNRVLARWTGRNPPRIVRGAMRQMSRFLDDLERRYPRRP